MSRFLIAAAAGALAAATLILAYQMCFTETTLGGYLPFLTVSASPVLTFVMGLAAGIRQ